MKRALLPTGLILLFLFAVSTELKAATFTVTTTSDNDCSDFNCDLQAALNAAETNNQSDTINIQSGTYNITGNSEFPSTPFKYAPVFPSTENFSLSIIGTGSTPPILDGNGTSAPFNQVLNIDTTGVNTPNDANAGITIQGITIQNGKSSTDGGGLFINTRDANILVENCLFMNNFSSNISGAAEIEAQSNGTITFNSNQFIGNSATNGIGGIDAFTDVGLVTFSANTFNGNTTPGSDGAIDIGSDHGAVDFSGNLLIGNKATGGFDGAGEADSNSGLVSLTNNIVLGNTALNDAGGLLVFSRDAGTNIINNTISGNNSGGFGGGIHVQLGSDTSVANIYNNIIWGNTATTSGSDILVEDNLDGIGVGAPVNLFNNDFTDFSCIGICTSNVVQSNNLMNIDPLFVDVANDDVHLQGGSQCIDAGLATAPGIPSQDFAGNPRILGSAPDMGALEGSALFVVTPLNHDFGQVSVANSSTTEITLANQGSQSLNVTGMTLSDNTNYSLDVNGGSNPCGSATPVLAAGQSCTVSVIFGPSSQGIFPATLIITSDDPQNPSITVSLTGTGSAFEFSGGGCSINPGPVSLSALSFLMAPLLIGLRRIFLRDK